MAGGGWDFREQGTIVTGRTAFVNPHGRVSPQKQEFIRKVLATQDLLQSRFPEWRSESAPGIERVLCESLTTIIGAK